MNGLTELRIKNFRSLANVSLDIRPVNVIFGPNGAGKSTILDTLYFFRDCAIRGVELASSDRSHGIGVLWDGAENDARISLAVATDNVDYELTFGLSSGRIEPFAGETLRSKNTGEVLIDRKVGTDEASLYHTNIGQHVPITLREPEKLSMGLFLDFNSGHLDAGYLDKVMHYVRLYHARSFFLYRLKREGSESSHEKRLWDRGDNAWSVLRNLHDKKSFDERYDTIMRYMVEAFPAFEGIILEQTGPNSVYASFREKGRRKEILASGVSDGHLQMLLLLTALFSEGDRDAVVLFDEPEISLHPWALAVLSKAVKFAAESWRKQVLIATHSPVLISQFEPEDILVAEIDKGCTRLTRLSQVCEIKDLLEEYAPGSLYMSEAVGPQSSGFSRAY
jgi:predicted ATPase